MDLIRIRKITQIVFLVASVAMFVLLAFGIIDAVAHEFCPFSEVCFGLFGLNPRVQIFFFPVATIIGFALTLIPLFLGRVFCSYACPFGTIQELLFKLRRTKKKFKHPIPYNINRYMTLIKYGVLLLTIVAAFFGWQRIYMGFCPALVFSQPLRIAIPGILTLISLLIGGFWIERFFCRYLCPFAALMNLMEYLGGFFGIKRIKIYRNIQTSLNCFTCANYCPMQIDIGYLETIESPNCIQCRLCVRKCSKKDASCCCYRD